MAKRKKKRVVRRAQSKRRRNPASLLMTVNKKTGARRYYINSRRVSREKFDAAKMWRRLDTFQTVTRGNLTRHYSEVRKRRKARRK